MNVQVNKITTNEKEKSDATGFLWGRGVCYQATAMASVEALAVFHHKFYGDAGGGLLLLRTKIRNSELLRLAEA